MGTTNTTDDRLTLLRSLRAVRHFSPEPIPAQAAIGRRSTADLVSYERVGVHAPSGA